MSHSASTLGFVPAVDESARTSQAEARAPRRGLVDTCRIVLAAMADGYAASHRYQVMRARGQSREQAAMAAMAELGPSD